MEKRNQVFVSSTYKDLIEERQKVISVLITLNCFPAAMEFFQASDEDQWSLIKRVIDQCDYYVLILGGMYGSIDPKTGLSYTEIEYDYAIATGKPTIAFVHENPMSLPQSKVEPTDEGKAKLEKFRKKVSLKVWRVWGNSDALALAVGLGMLNLRELRPSAGWIRADEAADPERMIALRNKVEDLEAQLALVKNQPPRGTEELAQGSDVIQLPLAIELHGQDRQTTVTTTWDDLFGIVGPIMMNPSSEKAIADGLSYALARKIDPNIYNAYVFSEAFQSAKLQLFALGLIERGLEPNTWKLSPFGESYLVRNNAVKKIPF